MSKRIFTQAILLTLSSFICYVNAVELDILIIIGTKIQKSNLQRVIKNILSMKMPYYGIQISSNWLKVE